MNDSETELLLSQAVTGNSHAVERLMLLHHGRLKRTIAAYLDPRLSGRIDPSDVLQDAMTQAAEKLPHYLVEQPIDFYPWIRQLVRDQLVDVHRRHIQAQRRSIQREAYVPSINETSAAHLVNYLVGSATSPSVIVVRKERRDAVRQALNQLAPANKEILLMRFVEQLRVQEIAQILAIPEATAKSRLRRSLEKMYRLVNLTENHCNDN